MSLRSLSAWYVAVFASPAVLLSPVPAHACSAAGCFASAILPESGSVPANQLEILWRPAMDGTSPPGTAGELRLYELSGERRMEVPTEQVLRDDGLVHVLATRAVTEGSELLIVRSDPCELSESLAKTHEDRLRVAPAAAAPTSLGKLTAQYGTGDFPFWVTSGECSRTHRTIFAEVSVAFSSDAAPFRDALRYALEVDGKPYDNGEWQGYVSRVQRTRLAPGKERVHTLCDGDVGAHGATGLAPGAHRVRMTAELADGTQIASDEIEVELRCPSMVEPSAEGAENQTPHAQPTTTGPDASDSVDVGAQHVEQEASSGAPSQDPTLLSQTVRATPEKVAPGQGSDCSLHHAGRRGSEAALLAPLGLFALLLRRRPPRGT